MFGLDWSSLVMSYQVILRFLAWLFFTEVLTITFTIIFNSVYISTFNALCTSVAVNMQGFVLKVFMHHKIIYILIHSNQMTEDVPLVEFMCLVSACMQGESYRRWLRSLLLCLGNHSWVLITFLVCWLTTRRLADTTVPGNTHTTVPGNTLFRKLLILALFESCGGLFTGVFSTVTLRYTITYHANTSHHDQNKRQH